MTPSQEQRWLLGLRLLRDGAFWEAHEAWEELWLSLPKDSAARRATKVLIQLAAICHKPVQAARGRASEKMQRGMERLLGSSSAHLEATARLGPPAPPWELEKIDAALKGLEEILNDWKAGLDLKLVSQRVTELARAFADDPAAQNNG
ncbi:MAG: DUF309 domain-containing protein [Bradymonadaceae bacterium]